SAVAQADKELPAIDHRGAPRRQRCWVAPDRSPCPAVQGQYLILLVAPADAGTDKDAAVGRRRATVDVALLVELPEPPSTHGVERVDAIVARAEEHAPVGNARRRFNVAGRGEVPLFL